MPTINADFAKISTEFEPLPPDTYICRVEEIEETKTRENQLPMLKISLQVDDPEKPDYADRMLFDNIVLQTNKGKANQIGLGQLKAYAIAAVGEEQANGSAIDTDEIKGAMVLVQVGTRSYTPPGESEPRVVNEVKKILPVA